MEYTLDNSIAYFRDKFVPFGESKLSIASSPVLYGLSVYTVIGAHWNEDQKSLYLFRLKDHYRRLVNSAKIMDFHSFASDWPYESFEKVVLGLLNKNDIKQDVLVRVTVFIDELMSGTKIHDLKNGLSAFVYPTSQVLPVDGANVCVSSWRRTADNSIPSRAKVNGSYVNSSLMKNEALLNGYDDAIAIDENGHVSEGTVANLFIVRDGALITPDASTDILEGITRDTIIKLAKNLSLDVVERSMDRSELYIADEAFLCGSSVSVTPILSIDKRTIGSGSIGEITSKLRSAYKSVQDGSVDEMTEWRLSVY